MTPFAVRLSPVDPPWDGGGGAPPFQDPAGDGADDLPYRVELWDDTGAFVELVVAVSLSPAVGYAAYYAATREYPGRCITLRHNSRVLSRWSANTH